MKLLLDTHIALWVIRDDPQLSTQARALISEAEEAYVSAASVWEVAIKHARHRTSPAWIAISGTQALLKFREAGLKVLAISADHAAAVDRLPVLHNDLFDRLLVAQALIEPLILLTHDRALGAYGDRVLLV